MRYIAGELLNFLEQARAITLSPAVDALFPVAGLYDGYADAICAHGSNGADPSVTVDLAMLDKDRVDNGNLDSWPGGSPTGWTVTASGGGAVTEATGGEARSGSAAKIQKSAGAASLKKTFKVRAGQRLNVEVYLRNTGAGQCQAQLYNPVTKRYLSAAGAWQSAQTYWATASTTSYVQKLLAFQVEDVLACQGFVAYLELSMHDTGGAAGGDYGLADDAFMWPRWNAVVVSGHNLEIGQAPTLRSSTDAFGGVNTQEALLTVRQPAFQGYLSTPSNRRYARLASTGTQSTLAGTPYYGELVITYLETAASGGASEWTYSVRYMPDNILSAPAGGKVIATRATQQRRRAIALHFTPPADAVMREQRDELHGRCHGALYPVILVPVDAEDVVVHGRIDETLEVRRLFLASWEDDVLVSENPFTRVTPS